MNAFRNLTRWIAGPLAVVMLLTMMPLGSAQAGLIATDAVSDQQQLTETRDRVATFLSRDDVRNEITALGLDADEATARVAALSDAEVAQIASQMDNLPAGEGAVGAVIGAALLIFIVLLITDIAGVTDVYSFTK